MKTPMSFNRRLCFAALLFFLVPAVTTTARNVSLERRYPIVNEFRG